MRTLEQWRLRVCLSRRELAKKAEVSPVTIWRIEHEKHEPQPITRRQIAQALAVDHQAVAWPRGRVS